MRRRGGSGRSNKRSGGGPRLVGSSTLVLIVGILAILGLGYYVQTHQKSEPQLAQTPAASGPKTAPETAKTEPVKTEPPKSEPTPDPNQVALQGRARINRAGSATNTMVVTAYYADGLKNSESLQPVQILVPFSQSQLRVTAEQILNAPEDLKLYSGVPAGTKIGKAGVNLNTQTGVVTVDVTAEMDQVQGSAAASTVMASFVYSLTEVPGVKAVQLWVNGRPAMLHGIEWSKPLTRDDIKARNLFQVEPVIKYAAKP